MTHEVSPFLTYDHFLDKHAGLAQPRDEHYHMKKYFRSHESLVSSTRAFCSVTDHTMEHHYLACQFRREGP